MFSILSQLFVPERHRQRAADVGFSVPAFSEVDVSADIDPLLATNMRGTFLRTRVSRQGVARFGYSECALDREGELLAELYRVLIHCARTEGWGTVSTVDEACERIKKAGLQPRTLVCPEGDYEGLRSLRSELPGGSALVVASPEVTGVYTRIGDYVGILAHRVNVTFVAVVP